MPDLIAFVALVIGFCFGWVAREVWFHIRAQRIYFGDGRELLVVEDKRPPRDGGDA